MSRNYTFAPDEYYHLYSRGVEKIPVYRSDGDYQRFLESLYLFNAKESVHRGNIDKVSQYRGLTSVFDLDLEQDQMLVHLGAYCLMPNHFHLLIRIPEADDEGKGVSKFMQKLMTSYTMYFNKKYKRTGALFGSSFKAKPVLDDYQLKYLFAYIHLNPKKILKSKSLSDYPYSSFQDYSNFRRPQSKIIHPANFPDYFSGEEETLEEWIKECEDMEV